jgi:LssY C-terminus
MHTRLSAAAFLAVAFVVTLSRPPVLVAQRLAEHGQTGAQTASPTDDRPGGSPQAPEKARTSRDIELSDKSVWTDTDIDLKAGERAVFTASGNGQCPGQSVQFGPNGLARGYRDLLRVLPVGQAGRGALIGRIGDKDIAQPFLIGEGREIMSPAGGILALGINQTGGSACAVEYQVHVDIYPAAVGTSAVAAKPVSAVRGVDDRIFARIPRRIADLQGNPGDMINFLLLGSESAMQRVFNTAGWVKVDADVRGALIAGVLDSLSKEAYVTMPMSQLYLFGRPQDFGWAHAEPIKVVASRHHLRVWQAPFQVDGSTLWVGAATHDIGFERDRRNNGVTHRIDPEVDLERDYVEKTLTATGIVSEFAYVLPPNPLRSAETATGGSFHSDGRVLILKVEEASSRAAENTALK